MSKKVLLIVIDACASRVLFPAMENGRLPHISALAQAGSIHEGCSAIFPSITPAATASIITGCYPAEHGIPGAYWYDTESEEVMYYGDDFWVIVNQGIDKFFKEFLLKLNHERLSANTLFQTVERAGLRAASLNYLIYRGDVQHKFRVPLLLRFLNLVPGMNFPRTVMGPSILELGDFVTSASKTNSGEPESTGGPFRSFGLEDDCTAELLINMAKKRELPDFTLAYFPENDFQSHEVGPKAAVTVLEKVDSRLGELFSVYGGPEEMLKELCVIMTGDHSQCDVEAEEDDAAIKLDQVLGRFSLAEAGEPWDKDEEIKACTNMRAAQIYFRRPETAQFEQVIAELINEPRIDQVIWQAELSARGAVGYRIATVDRGTMCFWPGSNGAHTAIDQQGFIWSWSGDMDTLGGKISDGNVISFPDYPNAFERIAGGLNCKNSGHLWVTARPGYEFLIPRTTVHAGGGSHGSLHALDSTVPLLLAGAPPGIELPANPRTVDVAPLCLSVLGIRPKRPVGLSHAKERAGHESS